MEKSNYGFLKAGVALVLLLNMVSVWCSEEASSSDSLEDVVASGDVNRYAAFLARGSIDIDHTFKRGRTALHIAAENGQKNFVEFLLREHARACPHKQVTRA